MQRVPRRIATSLLLLASFPASASGVDGLMTFLLGLPLLTMMCAALIWLLRRPRSALLKHAALVVLAGCFLYALSLVPDALSTLRLGPGGDAVIGYIFFALMAAVVVLAYRVIRQATPGRAN